jgi:hypothetical protein
MKRKQRGHRKTRHGSAAGTYWHAHIPHSRALPTIANHAVTHFGGKVVDNHSHVIPLLATSILDLSTPAIAGLGEQHDGRNRGRSLEDFHAAIHISVAAVW